ncbi:putative bifunctional diguanylate cyclase/phosphodiesterase [Afifella aestuarii]|uniref:putative bifunctional diguanylate cyclase/phosphodiesterase n=1 Tax=Afifella aestuarii TaxID=1909496 RepID=UPI0013E32E02|nr:EAL domain-containing protein [Afifella aestuarii]
MSGPSVKRTIAFVLRHKFRFIDFSIVLIATLAMLYVGIVIDIFANAAGDTPAEMSVERDELIAVSVIFLLGLVWAVRRMIRERQEAARKARTAREIQRLAFHDALTGLPNRRQFDAALKEAAASPPGSDASHAVMMLDLNSFKRVNDVFGHAAGDEVLMQVAARLRRAVRGNDLVARLGGDEFAVLATHISGAEAATGLALRIIDALTPPIRAGGGEHAVGTAIGICLTPQDGDVPAELLRKADIALYRAKGQGHSAMRFFEEEMDQHVRERSRIEAALREAIQTQTITPSYQPLVDMKTGTVKGFEALARWDDPELGKIGPDRFIPVAEDSGLITALTDLLLSKACHDAATWPGKTMLSFNVSPLLLRDPNFGMKVIALLGRTGFPAERLELEITESALVRDLAAAQATLGTLRQAGVRIALDDFGTGYSSLYHLRNFKLDSIKIDRSFIHSMATDPESAAIVKALVGLGAGLGLEVTAEGVETEEQRLLLAEQGCNQAQGFFYSEALGAQEALNLFASIEAARRSA